MNLQVFKNGFALVSRSFDLPAANQGQSVSHSLGSPPQHACHGTVWFTTSQETKVDGLRSETRMASAEVPCTSVQSLLKANAGCMVAVKVGQEWLSGEVIQVSESSNGAGLLSLACPDDAAMNDSGKRVLVIPLRDVMQVKGSDEMRLSTVSPERKQELIVDYQGVGGSATLVHLRRGFCWAPSYHWQLQDEVKATLSGNATIMNESEEGGLFEKLECVVGAPNMKFEAVQDPLFVSKGITNFLQEMSARNAPNGLFGQGIHNFPAPPQMMMQQQVVQQVPVMNSFVTAAQPPEGDDAEFVDLSSEAASGADDVHFLEFDQVRLEPNARVALPIFCTEAAYSTVFRASLSGSVSGIHIDDANNSVLEVWRALRVTNRTQKPWTTAPVMISRAGSFIAQGMVPYTPVGAEALVNITRALNVRCKYEMAAEDTGAQEVLLGKPYGVQHRTTTISVCNGKPVDVDFIVDFSTSGQLLECSVEPTKNVEVSETLASVHELNRKRDLQFTLTVPAGSTREITWKCKLLYRHGYH